MDVVFAIIAAHITAAFVVASSTGRRAMGIVKTMNETFPTTPIALETFAQRIIALDTLRHAIVDLWEFAQRERRSDGFSSADVMRLEEIRQIVLAERPLLKVSRETALQYKEFLHVRGIFGALPRDASTDGILFFERIPAPANSPFRTGCVWCDKGHKPIQSSVSDKMVHTGMRTVEDRVVCTRRTESPREKSNDEHSASHSESRSNTTASAAAIPGVVVESRQRFHIKDGGRIVFDDAVHTIAGVVGGEPTDAAADKTLPARRSAAAPRNADAKIRSRGKKRRRGRRPRGVAGRKNPRHGKGD